MDNVSRKMEILRKSPKEIQEMKDTVLEMKSAFEGLIGLDVACGVGGESLTSRTE